MIEYTVIEYNVKVYDGGNKYWYLNDKLHCEHGPAIELARGSKEWYLHGKLHREDGPAIDRADGTKRWYLDGKLHREDGPAIERAEGTKRWYLDDKQISEAEFNRRMNNPCSGKVVEIEGVQYKLVEV